MGFVTVVCTGTAADVINLIRPSLNWIQHGADGLRSNVVYTNLGNVTVVVVVVVDRDRLDASRGVFGVPVNKYEWIAIERAR